ncbi:MAG TPA: DUF402 domain-containing protein [Candidatus Saccharimonadales bacterium]|nr:DUF402 domain-containing protein [Candidatus Saccharimonadales bacterium]
MSTHAPKHISSTQGLGLNTTKTMKFLSDNLGIGTEVWNELEEPWQEGDVVIAEPGYKWVTKWETGKPYIINKFHNASGQLVGVYCDVARPIRLTKDGFEFDDLYLDVWQIPGKDPIILDEDELEAALEAGYISADEAAEARRIALFLVKELQNNKDFLIF